MLSVIIIAKNEADNIGRCLQSVSFAQEIIVLDSGSTDNTVAIAKEFTTKVFETDWQGYGVQKQRALELATGDWVLNLDADESVTPELQQAIEAAMNSDKADAYRIAIQMVFYDKLLKYSGSPKRHIRLFKREHATYSKDIVHEKIQLPPHTRIGKIKAVIRHHSFQDLSHALYKINKYSSYSAKIRLKEDKKTSFMRTLMSANWMFWRCLILQRGFLDGWSGLLFAILGAQGAFYRGMKQIHKDKHLHQLPNVILTNKESVE